MEVRLEQRRGGAQEKRAVKRARRRERRREARAPQVSCI